jgi:glycosyltransferase involved in cell wall biosynthesis
VVVTWHNAVLAGGVRGRLSRLAERVVARSVRVALGASTDLVQRARDLGATRARLAPVAAPALPAPARRRAAVRAEVGVTGERPLVLSVGRLHPQKRYDVLIDAAARWRLRDPAPVVVVAGSGPAYLPLAARISAARAPVTLLGHRTDVADLLAGADLAVVTSDWEARQLFAQEALRAGVPLVATAVGGLPELVGEAALLVPAGDVDAVDAAVRSLLDDPALRADLAARGRARAATWPTEADTVADLAALYAELAPAPYAELAPAPPAPGDPERGAPAGRDGGTPAGPEADTPSTGRR